MILEVPYFKQDTDDSCGPAVLHMLTAHYGLSGSKRAIQRMVNIDPHHGVKNDDLVAAAEELGFEVHTQSSASVDDVENFLKKKQPVVLNFIEPKSDEGHYTLAIGIDKKNIVLNDPLLGEGYRIPISEFESRWRSGFEDRTRWLMVVTPKPSSPSPSSE